MSQLLHFITSKDLIFCYSLVLPLIQSQAFQDLWTNERLLNVVEQFIGPDIAGHPVWNLRTKVSENKNDLFFVILIII